jgi:hypothetical protein
MATEDETIRDIEDATKPFNYKVSRSDIRRAFNGESVPSPSNSDKQRRFTHCVQEVAIMNDPRVLDCRYFKTVAYVVFKDRPDIAVRYLPTNDGKKVAEINDSPLGDKGLRELIPLGRPLRLRLNPPRRNRSLEYLRSDEMKQIREDSKERRKGKPTRDYTSPSKRGYRNGTGAGKAHNWKLR